MPDYARRPAPGPGVPLTDEQKQQLLVSPFSNEFLQEAYGLLGEDTAPVADKEQMVLYLSLNSTTHHKDELPETLAAAQYADKKGLGEYHVLPISDPYADGTKTYEHSFGKEHAGKMTWWQEDPKMKEGEVRFGEEEPVMLGTENAKDPKELQKVQQNWRDTLAKLGMDKDYIDKTVTALMTDSKGDPKALGSGDGAVNELLQYTMAMYRAEKGEYEASSIVFSGHHWEADRGDDDPAYDVLAPDADGTRNLNSEGGIGKGIWGERPDHSYDYRSDDGTKTGGDFFSLEDVGSLKNAFPKAYSQVDSVQFAACNTYSLGINDEKGNPQNTPEWLQSTFPNIQMASYWSGLAPVAKQGANYNGEFLLDHAKLMAGDEKAAKDARYTGTGSGKNKRAVLNDQGTLEEIDPTKNTASYFGGSGLRGADSSFATPANEKKYGDYLYTAPDLEQKSAEREKEVLGAIADFFGLGNEEEKK